MLKNKTNQPDDVRASSSMLLNQTLKSLNIDHIHIMNKYSNLSAVTSVSRKFSFSS